MRDLGVTEGDISATTGHSIAVMRAVYSHPLPMERRGETDAIAAALANGHQTGADEKNARETAGNAVATS